MLGFPDEEKLPDLRWRWLERGCAWHSKAFQPPPEWNAAQQLRNLLEFGAEEAGERWARDNADVATHTGVLDRLLAVDPEQANLSEALLDADDPDRDRSNPDWPSLYFFRKSN